MQTIIADRLEPVTDDDEQQPGPISTPGHPRAGWIEDMEREDDDRGFEAEPDATAAFFALVAHLVTDGDMRAAAAGRRARRTLREMEPDRDAPPSPTAMTCPSCGGAGGRMEETNEGGVKIQTWRTCGSCGGKREI